MDGPSSWAEIDSILAAIDPNRASWISQLEVAAAADGLLIGLDDWAALNRLEEEILAALLAHGFDSAGFINGVLSDADLQEMGVASAAQRRRILAAVQDLPNQAMQVAESLSDSVSLDCFLRRLCLSSRQLGRELAGGAADVIAMATTVNDLASVTEAELQQRFGVRKLGHRRRIICCLDNARALRRLRRPQLQQQQQQTVTSSSNHTVLTGHNGIQHSRQNSNLSSRSASSSTAAANPSTMMSNPSYSSSCPSSSENDDDRSSMLAAASAGIANRRLGAKQTRTTTGSSNSKTATLTEVLPRREQPTPLPANAASRSWMMAASGDNKLQSSSAWDAADEVDMAKTVPLARCRSSDGLDRASGEFGKQRQFGASSASAGAASAFRPLVSEAWPHHPDVLLRDSFSYSVSYLGFRPLADHTDPAETAQVMLMFRCKSADILKLPRIRLTVSYRGVKFINPDNDMVITEHRITEIYFASQDNTRRANFAYVTKDSVNNVHYCHCFASHSPETAVLIIQTLSEACGLANQLIEFNQLRRQQLQQDEGGRRRSTRKRSRRT